MSLLSGLSNIFHGIGHVLSGSGDDQKKKKQQLSTSTSISPKPGTVIQPTNNVAEQLQAPTQNLNLTPLQKATQPSPAVKAPVVDASTLVKAAQVQPNPIGPNAQTGSTDWKGIGRAAVAAPVATAIDATKGISGLVDLLPGKGENRVSKALDKANSGVSKFVGPSQEAQDALRLGTTALSPATLAGPGDLVKAVKGVSEVGSAAEQALTKAGTPRIVSAAKKATGFFNDIPVLAKAVASGHVNPVEANEATKVAEGVHTVNPNRPTDAADQLGVDATPPEPVAPPPSPAPTEQPVIPAPNGNVSPELPVDTSVFPSNNELAPVETPPIDKSSEQLSNKQQSKSPTAPNAPGIRAAAAKRLDSIAKESGNDSTTHDVLSNPDLLEAGKAHTDTFNDADLVNEYKNGFTPHGAADIAKGHAALDRLNEIAKTGTNEDAAKAIDNIIEGSEKEFSQGGRTVNYAQQFYDGLKGPAKTSYLVRQIDKVRESAGLPLLKDNVDLKSSAEDIINKFITNEEAIKGKIATAEQRLAEIKDHSLPENGGGNKQLTKEANTLNGVIKDHNLELSKNTSGLAKYYDEVAPRSVGAQTKIGDLGRTLMLTSGAGRVNDVLTTAVNSSHQLATMTGEGLLGKAAGKKPGAVIDTLPSPSAVARGVKFGVKKSVARFKGDVAGGNSTDLLKKADSTSGKGQLLNRNTGITGGLRKVVRAGTEIATDLSEGIKEAQVQRLATQQGKQLGLTGENLKTYTAAQTAAPTRQMLESGDKLQAEVNNMHDNPITDALTSVSSGIAKIPVIGEQLKNLTLPFTRWTGGQLHNALVDKNALVNAGQIIKAASKGDTQGAITAASKLAVNGVGAIGAGYALSKAGLLTHENAQGYNDDGVYLHVNGRYIPATFLGFFAPGIILGASAHDAMQKNGNGKGSVLSTAVDTTADVMKNAFLAFGGQSLTGQSQPAIQAFQNAQETGYKGVPPVIAGQVAGQYIPAATGDVNAALNNGAPLVKNSDKLNKTHEAALTKATSLNEKTGNQNKNITKTVENQLLNKVPIASQKLPRNKGVAANDEIDRITRGDRDTKAGLQTKATAKTVADTAVSNEKKGIPDPNAKYAKGDSFDNAVESRIENKKYDQAISGLQQKLDQVKKSKDATSKQTAPIDKQIKTVQVLKKGNYDPAIRDTYSKTSLSEWRDMGDSTSDNYDLKTYELLFNYDKDLANSGVSSSSLSTSDPKYTLKDTSKSSAKESAAAAKKSITSNTLGSTPTFNLPDISLSPKKITDAASKIPTIQQIKAGDLIKKRTISVGKVS